MKIVAIEALHLIPPSLSARTVPRRPGYLSHAPHIFPLAKYPEFPRLVKDIPGVVHPEIWIRVTAEDGKFGLGQCHWGDLVEPVIRAHFAPLLIGRDAFAHEFLNDLMWRYSQRFGSMGIASVARSGIDQALWDLKGKLLGQPVWRLLGGRCREEIDLYATTDDLDWAMELGFRAFKISNPVHYDDGTAGLNLLEDKIAAARQQVGPDADLMFNPNMSFNVEFASRLMERLLPYRLRWIEEPLIPADLEGHIQLKKAFPGLPIATGEDHHGRHAFRQLIEARAVDVLQPDIRWCGGLTETLKIYAMAESAGLTTSTHAGGAIAPGLHFAAAMPEIGLTEYWMPSAPGVPLGETVLPGMPVPVNGRIRPGDAPGFGLELRAEDFKAWQ